MAQKVFKGFIQVVEAQLPLSPEAGYIYFVRTTTGDSKEDGYLLFNGRKYGTASELATELRGKIGTIPEGYTNLVDYINAQVSSITSDYATKEEVGTLSGRVDALSAVSAETRINALEAISADTRLNTIEADYLKAENLTGITADIEALDGRVDAAEADIDNLELSAHTHTNKDVLDGITAEKVAAWDAAEDNAIAAASAYTDSKVSSAISMSEVVLSAYTGESATAGYLKTYEIFQGGDSLGRIDIPKDLVVTSGSVVEVEGVKYLRLYIANDPEHPVDIAVSDLAHVYTQGNGVEISESDVISAKVVAANGLSVDSEGIKLAAATSEQAGAMSAADKAKLDTIAASAQTNVIEGVQVNGVDLTPDANKKVNVEIAALPTTAITGENNGVSVTVGQNANGVTAVTVTAPDVASLSGSVETIEDDYLKAADKTALEGEIGTLSGRVDTLEANAATKTEVGTLSARVDTIEDELTGITADIDNLELSAHTHANKDVLDAITSADTEAWSAALQEVVSSSTIDVTTKANGKQTVSVKVSSVTGNTIEVKDDGLFAAIYYDGDDAE